MRKFICVLALFLATFASHAQAPDAAKSSLFLSPVMHEAAFVEATTQSCIWFPLPRPGLYVVAGSKLTGYSIGTPPCEDPEYRIEINFLDINEQYISQYGNWLATGWEDIVQVPDRDFWPMNVEYIQVCYSVTCPETEWEKSCCEAWKLVGI